MLDFGIKTHSIGRDGYVWWVGQIASEDSWKENKPENPKDSNEDIKGFGERYRVAIVGYTPFDTQEVTDDELQWASVEYPVTAGAGGRAYTESCGAGGLGGGGGSGVAGTVNTGGAAGGGVGMLRQVQV